MPADPSAVIARQGWRPSRNRMPGARILAAAGAVLAALGVAALVAAAVGMRSAASPAAGRLQVMALSVPAQRELENFQVALDGKIIAREPNGDVIDVSPPAWRDWIKNVEAGRD